MARPKKEESIRRTSNVMVRFSSIEYELVAGYAKDAGYPISTFVRKQALSEKVTVNYNIVADIGEIQNLTAQAAGIGNNLNQVDMIQFMRRRKKLLTKRKCCIYAHKNRILLQKSQRP